MTSTVGYSWGFFIIKALAEVRLKHAPLSDLMTLLAGTAQFENLPVGRCR